MDTGASLSLMRKDLAEQLKLKSSKGKEIRVKIGDNTFYTVSNTTTCNVNFDGVVKQHTFYIYENLPHPIILGITFICQYYITIKATPNNIKISTGVEEFMFLEEQLEVEEKVTNKEETTIKAHSARFIKATVDRVGGNIVIKDNFMPMLTICGGLYLVTNHCISLRVENHTPFPVLVHKDQKLSTVEELDDEGYESSSQEDVLNDKEYYFKVSDDLDEAERAKITEVLNHNKDVFARTTAELTQTDILVHRIKLTDTTPITKRQFNQANIEKDAARAEIRSLLNAGIIEASSSDWSSPYFMIKKKDGSLRMVQDYRAVNARTVKDCYNLPNMSQILEGLAGKVIFSTADLMKGFHQVLIHPDDRPFTSFWCDYGLFQFRCLGMGLVNAPATFQRVIDHVLRDIVPTSAVAYLDDLMIYGRTLDEHRENLQLVFNALRKANLKLHIEKCYFGVKQVVFLGVLVTPDGLKPDPKKLAAVSELKAPSCVRQVREVLGLMGFYRKFVPRFSIIAAPLHKLTNKEQPFDWTPECETSFGELKSRLIMAPILVHYDPTQPVVVCCDASAIGIGAVLSHRIDDDERPIAYTSRLLSRSERNLSATDRELLGLVNALKKFRHFLIGIKFTVITDHQPLTHLINLKDPHGRISRMLVFLMPFQFDICYRKGKKLVNADCLSRMPVDPPDKVTIDDEVDDWLNVNEGPDLITMQVADDYCKAIDSALQKNSLRTVRAGFGKLDGVLVRNVTTQDGTIPLVVLPAALLPTILKQCHEDSMSGHGGVSRTLARIQNRFYRRKLPKLVRGYVRSCMFCQMRKPRNHFPEGIPMSLPTSSTPMEIICADFAGPVNTSLSGNRYIFAVIDVCTRYLISEPTANQSSETVMDCLLRRVIYVHGAPSVIITDHGTCFTSAQFQLFLKEWNIQHRMSSAYHPMSNGIIEQSNKTMGIMLSRVYMDHPSTWDRHLVQCDLAFNSSVNRATKRTPYELLHLRMAPAKCDSLVKILRSRIIAADLESAKEVREIANRNLRKEQAKTIQYRKARLIEKHYEKGDKVFVFKPQGEPSTCKKFKILWRGPFEILRKMPGLEATYEVKVIEKNGKQSIQKVNTLNLRRCEARDSTDNPTMPGRQIVVDIVTAESHGQSDQLDSDSDETAVEPEGQRRIVTPRRSLTRPAPGSEGTRIRERVTPRLESTPRGEGRGTTSNVDEPRQHHSTTRFGRKVFTPKLDFVYK